MSNATKYGQLKRASAIPASVVSVVFCGLFAWGLAPQALADSSCTATTLHGPYGFSETGSITAGPFVVAGIAFDGGGGSAFSFKISFEGATFPASGTATYTVHPDCTATIHLSSGETLFGAIATGGRELQFMNATQGFLGTAGGATRIATD